MTSPMRAASAKAMAKAKHHMRQTIATMSLAAGKKIQKWPDNVKPLQSRHLRLPGFQNMRRSCHGV
jgi:hypothetical protein